MNTKTNQRYQKTEQQIIETFLDLLRRMPLKQIHVRTLCDACGLNRSSFYLHFQDLSDLMQKTELVLIRNAEHLASSGAASETEEARFARYFAFIQQYQVALFGSLYRILHQPFCRFRISTTVPTGTLPALESP